MEGIEAARKVMQTALENAIAENNVALQNRIQDGQQHLNTFENLLPNLAASTSERIDVVLTIQERYNNLTDSLTSLETQRELLESTLAAFKSKMEGVIYNKLQEHATSGELNELFEKIKPLYDEATDIVNGMEIIYYNLEDITSNLPHIDYWLSDLELYFSEIDNALDLLSDFESLDLDSILDKCKEVEDNADEMGDRIESAANSVLELAATLNDLLSFSLDGVESRITGLEDLASEIDDISAVMDGFIGEF